MKNRITKIFFIAIFCSLMLSFSSTAQIVINEGSNRNYSTLADEDGDYPDWIELYNAGSSSIDLFDYTLTDDAALPAKWSLPHMVILPGQYKIIFCSKKNRAPTTSFINVVTSTNFNATTGWNTHNFTTPFLWDGISNVIVNTCSYTSNGYTSNSVMNQTTMPYSASVSAYNDGSPAACGFASGAVSNMRPNMQLNGIAIGTGTVQNCNTCYPAPYGDWYWCAKNQMIIRASEMTAAGLLAGNITSLGFDVVSPDPATYDYIDINMKLVTQNAVTANFITVDTSNSLHTNFKISTNGDSIYLFNTVTQSLESSLWINSNSLDVSNGLFLDASSNVVLFQTPTPGNTNNNSATFTYSEIIPSFNIGSGNYQSPLSVIIYNINLPSDSSQIYYTTNGDDPTTASTLYTGTPINIFYSTILKARAFANNVLPSPIAVASYLMGVSHVTPILSVVTDNANLYGSGGIFDNWQQDWTRPAYVEYFDTAQYLIFSRNAGMQIDGGAGGSRSHAQHSFRIEMSHPVIGDGSVNYPIIPNRPNRTKYSNMYLRNGSNQFMILPHKDASAVMGMCEETNNYFSAWRPISVYINGSYFGLYELREKFDTEYFKTLEGANPDSVDIFSASYWYGGVLRSVEGSTDSFYVAYNAMTALNPIDTGFWNMADKYFDMTYYTDYLIGESWFTNVDWPYNNIKIYRSDKTNYRYRFCTIDLELGFAPNYFTDCYFDHINYMLNGDPNIPYINVFLRAIQNKRFHDHFINRFADLMNTSYLPSRLIGIESTMFNQTVVEMQNEFARWGNPNAIPQQMNDFYNNHIQFDTQIAARTPEVRNHIQTNFSLANQVDLTLDVFPPGAGTIHISTITPTTYPWQGVYFNGIPVKIEAIPNPGYNFLQWGDNGIIADTLNIVFNDTLETFLTNFTAYFAINPVGISSLSSNEQSWLLFPNPATNNLFIINNNNNNQNKFSYQILDLAGRVLISEKNMVHSTKTEINIIELPEGAYLLQLFEGNEISKQFKFVKTSK
ncbi:MAG: T9SS type A sorting domain-containing protein [Bacteroidetes bacterium]|nr:T9SS type A sorting domain-containing protein [Bacteroidota bacterium]PHX82235.1 MAG: hypothetical protein CK539_05655 [Flavobacteriales bacterium]